MCVEAVLDTTGLHVSILVLGEAMVWQARLVLRLNAIVSSYFNIFVLGTHPLVHHKNVPGRKRKLLKDVGIACLKACK